MPNSETAPYNGNLACAHVHRFRAFAALYVRDRAGRRTTVYMTSDDALRLAAILTEAAEDIQARAFTDSSFSSREFEGAQP